jgi:RimJ/RimL family protein N-acetyltransferase
MTVRIERLGSSALAAYRALMLQAYAESPDAFVATVAERESQPESFWLKRLDDRAGAQECSFGAFDGDELMGSATLAFEARPKTAHKASLVGMYVQPAVRQQGLGRRLVQAVLQEARSRPEARVVKLTVTDGNASAEALYARCGFRRFGIEPLAMQWQGRFFNKVHMACVLVPEGIHSQ